MKNLEEYPEVLSVREVQQILRIGRGKAYELVNSKEFRTVRSGKRILISKNVLKRWLEENIPA